MTIDVVPELQTTARAALARALAEAGVPIDGAPDAYRGSWWRAAVQEAVEGEPVPESYAPSPRSTRGATRA